jgi:hypothetical protein
MVKTLESRFVPNDWAVMEQPGGPTRIVKITQVLFGTDANRPTDLVVTCLCETEKGDWKSPRPVFESDLFNPDEWLRLKLAKNRNDACEIRRQGKHLAAMMDRMISLYQIKKEV